MEKELVDLIARISEDNSLVATLNLKDYDEAIAILQDLYLEYDMFLEDHSFFTSVHKAIEEENYEKLDEIIAYSEKLFFIDIAVNLIEMYQKYEDEEENVKKDDNYFRYRTELTRLDTITDEDVEKAIKNIFEKRNQNYSKVDALKFVLNLNIDTEEKNDVMANYLEGLIYGNELTYHPLIEGVLLKNMDIFMEQYLMMVYLKKLYYNYKKSEIDNYQYLIRSIENLGLK